MKKKNAAAVYVVSAVLTAVIIIAAVAAGRRETPPDTGGSSVSATDGAAATSEPNTETQGDVTTSPAPGDDKTEPPATEPPVTEPPATEPPATEPPETEPPETEPPETEPPETEPPTPPPSLPEITYTGNMPVLVVDSGNEEIVSKVRYVPCTFTILEKGETTYTASAQVRVRGNSSAFYGHEDEIRESGGEVPYKIKLDKKDNLLGLHDGYKFRDWVLLRCNRGSTMIGNSISLRLGRLIVGEDEYCADTCFVRLVVNGVDLGPYILTEQNEVKKNRVDINEPEAGNTSVLTGYYLVIENYTSGEIVFPMNYEKATVTDVMGKTKQFKRVHYAIKSDITDDAQKDFIAKYMQNAFKIVYEACEKGSYLAFDDNFDLTDGVYNDAESAVSAVLDLDSVVNMYILYEIVHDHDVGEGSFYMYVDLTPGKGDGHVHFTSPWDFDWICKGSATGKFRAAAFNDDSFSDVYGERSNPWFIVLYKQDWFKRLVSERWEELDAVKTLNALLDEESESWKQYPKEIGGASLVSWMRKRIDWLDEQWGK